jgi:hypothetical protein
MTPRSSRVYELHGLRILSEIPLGDPAGDGEGEGPYDLTVTWQRGDVVTDGPERRLLAEASWGGIPRYRHVETATGFRLEFRDTCQVRVTLDRCSASVRLAPGVNPGVVPVFLEGNVLALLLLLAGEAVLHASGVSIGGQCVAFMGGSGAGKSTLAGLCCAAGAELVSDDLLRLVPDGQDFRCLGGRGEVRLRPGAVSLAALFRGTPCHTTADRRLALRVRDGAPPPARLAAIVAPVRIGAGPTRLERLGPLAAWQATLEAPRIAGLRDRGLLGAQFEMASRLAQRVPVFRGEIAAGPPFASSVGAELLAAVGLR